MIKRLLYFCLLFLGFVNQGLAQLDFRKECLNISWHEASLPLKDQGEPHSPKKATIMSAVIPGLGQIYNEKYWKVAVIYAAGAGLGYGLKLNMDSLDGYQKALVAELDEDSNTTNTWYPNLSIDKIRSERNYYRKNRDRMILGLGALYALQIIDANVDAHLREFDINPDLAVKPNPGYSFVNGSIVPTLGLSFRF